MKRPPPQLLVALVRGVIPPPDREHILGDLHERLQSSDGARPVVRYVFDAMQTVPLVVWSRMRRVMAHVLFSVQALMFSAAFVAAAITTRNPDGFTFLVTEHGFLRIGIPTLVCIVTLLFADTYAIPGRRGPWGHLAWVGIALGTAWVSHAIVGTLLPPWALPQSLMLRALLLGGLSVSWARFVFALRGIERQLDSSVPATLGDLRVQVQRFESGIRRRSHFAYATCLVVAAGFVRSAMLTQNLLQAVGAGLVVAAVIILAYEVFRHSAGALPTDADYEVSLRFYRRELERQRDFHCGRAFWLRMAVFTPGPLIFDAGMALARPANVRTVGIHAILFVALVLASVLLNLRTARRYERQIARVTLGSNKPS